MSDRSAQIDLFLDVNGWGLATRAPLAGDASNRRYLRVFDDCRRAVLMDAPSDRGEDVRPFVRIAQHLSDNGLSAPAILAKDEDAGLLLLEDLGDEIYARVLERQPEIEMPLYEAAIDALLHLHRAALPDSVGAYDTALMTNRAALAYSWYRLGATGTPDSQLEQAFRAELETVLDAISPASPVLILRDYHAENLVWLPARDGVARVGQLDFQDALSGHPAYDLVSLLKDARRDVKADVQDAMIARMIEAGGHEDTGFRKAYAVLGAQRNLRILGIFARLSLHFGKPHYVDLIPRVWGHVMTSLDHPALATLKALVLEDLPPPSPAILKTLKDKCATVDHP